MFVGFKCPIERLKNNNSAAWDSKTGFVASGFTKPPVYNHSISPAVSIKIDQAQPPAPQRTASDALPVQPAAPPRPQGPKAKRRSGAAAPW